MHRHQPSLLCVLVPCLLGWGCVADPPSDVVEASDDTDAGSSTGFGETTSGDDDESGEPGTDSGEPGVCEGALASGVTLRDVALFQVLAVDALRDGAPVDPASRRVPLIAWRDAVVRAQLDVDASWETHDLGLSVEVTLDGVTETFVGIGDDPEGGLVVDLPATVMVPGAEYSVSVIDCEAGAAGTAESSRFPVDGAAPLGVVETGPIAIHLVPFEVGGFVPDTSEAVVDGFRDAVYAVYPATAVEITVGPVIPDENGGDLDMGDLLVRLGEIQEQEDQAAPNVYYYGLVTGAASREEFCDDCPTGTSEAGNGNRAAFAIGAAFADQRSEDTLIHELGHMHGLFHAPCGSPSDVDESFPHSGAVIDLEGYDVRTDTFVPADHVDLMAYCYPRWVSDYSYRKLVDWVAMSQSW